MASWQLAAAFEPPAERSATARRANPNASWSISRSSSSASGVDLLLDQLVGTLQRLLELLLDLRLAEHDHGCGPRLELLAELLEVAARDALREVPGQAAGAGTITDEEFAALKAKALA